MGERGLIFFSLNVSLKSSGQMAVIYNHYNFILRQFLDIHIYPQCKYPDIDHFQTFSPHPASRMPGKMCAQEDTMRGQNGSKLCLQFYS